MVGSARANKLSLLMLAGFAALFLNLVRMQILRGDYYHSLSERNRIRMVYLEAARGQILDRNQAPLATSRLSFNCSVIPREAKSRIQQSCKILSPILNRDAEELESRFRKKKPGVYNTVLIAEDINPSQAMAIEERLDFLPGFVIETRPLREYPYAESAAHLLGYTGPVTEEELDTLEFYGYRPADWLGREGVEKTYESYLRGHSGGLQMEVNNRGRYVRALGVKEPREGKDIQLTVDARLQAFIQGLLKNEKGAVMAMELGEGGILAINSAPSFDPNLFSSTKGRREVGRFLHDSRSPMVNRGIRGQYPPGSIFKIVTALAAFDRQRISPVSTFQCPGFSLIGGKLFHCWREAGHGPQSLSDAFAHSCNVYFYTAGLLAGVDAIYKKAVELGFSHETGIDLPGEKRGFVPSREWKEKAYAQSWYDGETANLAIGQGYLQTTPIQELVMIAAAATEGQIFKPHVIDKIEGIKVAERHARSLAVSSAYWKAVKNGLSEVINSDSGTGRLARVPGLRIAGKTGTAQSGQNKTHAWFVGYAPEDNPKIALVVFLEHGGRGGVAAANVAGSVFKWLKEARYL